MEHRVFREDGGRVYQATNDEYSLPADEIEIERLNVQHKAFKTMQLDTNYLAPMDKALKHEDGEEKRLLDIGTGTGIWAVEMALEFPHVQVIGIDLSPVQYKQQIPDNCHFALEDAAKGLPYPDGYFDVVHARALAAGIRDWPALVNEAVRVVKQGGLVTFMELGGGLCLHDVRQEDADQVAPGFMAFSRGATKGFGIRGMDVHAAVDVIPKALQAHDRTCEPTSVPMPVPLAPWSEDPLWKKVGQIMVPDSKAVPETVRLLVTDACGMTKSEYDQIVEGYQRDLFEIGVPAVVPMVHVWAWRL